MEVHSEQRNGPDRGRPLDLSEILARRSRKPSDDVTVSADHLDLDDRLSPYRDAPKQLPERTVPWNSERARLGLSDLLDRVTEPITPLNVEWEGGFICTEPLVSGGSGGGWSYEDQVAGTVVSYYRPGAVFPDEDDAGEWAATIRARMPFWVPYRDDVVPTSPWQRGGGIHAAIDYVRTSYPTGEDPAYPVHAVGDGTVVTVVWDDTAGNVVIIEHQAPNSDHYRSMYLHLRNGFDHDRAMAKAMPDGTVDTDGNPNRQYKYYRYARLDGDPLEWGTNNQTILVNPGDTVHAGDQIGWSGNTGWGGAGFGLQDDGTPSKPGVANNHLHFSMAVPDPSAGSDDWVLFDPYGVYGEIGDNCYDLDKDAPYERMFAPFHSTFHGIPADRLARYWGYWTGMGRGLRTLSVHGKGDELLASGSFQSSVDSDWRARMHMTFEQLDEYFDTYHDQGLRPFSLDVEVDGNGNPRYTVIWRKRGSEWFLCRPALSDAELESLWKLHVEEENARLDDVVTYWWNGQARHCVLFVNDGDPSFIFHPLMTQPDFADKYAELDPDWWLEAQHATLVGGEARYNAIWRPADGKRPSRVNLDRSAYQAVYTEMTQNGFRLHQVQGYHDSSLYAGIWTNP